MSKKKPAPKKQKPADPAIETIRRLVAAWDEADTDCDLPMQAIFERVSWSHMPSEALVRILTTIVTEAKQADVHCIVEAMEAEQKSAEADIRASKIWDEIYDATQNEKLASNITAKFRALSGGAS